MTKKTIELEIKSEIGKVNKDIKETGGNMKKLGKETKKTQGGFKKLGGVMKGFGNAIKNMGIGMIVGILALLAKAMSENQRIMNGVATVTTTVSNVFGKVVDVLVDTYDWVTKSTERFDGLTKVMQGLVTLGLTPIKLSFFSLKLASQELQLAWEKSFLGSGDTDTIKELSAEVKVTRQDILDVGTAALEAGSNIINNFTDAVGEIGAITEKVVDGVSLINVKAINEQAKLQTELANTARLAEANLVGLIEKNDKLAEVQRQIRDDESKTFEERIEANTELSRVLNKQEEDMLALSDMKVAAAKLELDANKENIDLQIAYKTALNDRAGVEAQITGFRSEQMVNEVALSKELLAVNNELSLEGLSAMDRELQDLKNSYDMKLDMARKSGADTTAITKQYEGMKKQIILDRVSTELDAYGSIASGLSTLAGENKTLASASVVIDTAKGVMKAYGEGGPLGFIGAGVVIANGIKSLQQINSTKIGGSAGISGGSISAITSAKAAPPAPSMSGSFQLNNNAKQEPIEAYVITDKITKSQSQLGEIRRRATI